MDKRQGKRQKLSSNRGETIIKIVAASYGPSEGKRLSTGELSNNDASRIPLTRDATPYLRAWLAAHSYNEETSERKDNNHPVTIDESYDGNDLLRLTGQQRNFIPIMDGQSMNAIFGDPCPGTSKKLKIQYIIYESMKDATSRAVASEIHRVSFAEHERVTIRRRTIVYHDDDAKLRNTVAAQTKTTEKHYLLNQDDDIDHVLSQTGRLGQSQLVADIAQTLHVNTLPSLPILKARDPTDRNVETVAEVEKSDSATHLSPSKGWRLQSETSEVVLPILLPLLEVRERAQCQLVCKTWRFVVKNWGVAQTIDVNDEAFPNFTRQFLCGVLAHSHHSLQSLFLNDFQDLHQDDLHPALPYLRKLRSLDISRCNQLDDTTMHLISNHLNTSLEVLYLKGLRRVTDDGLISICRCCRNLRVLEISNIPITDVSAICIGENLKKLNALYARDNYLLTNKSIDVITEKCTNLTQLTLWGCTRLRYLIFERDSHRIACGKLVLLNLWGCHSLMDDAAISLGSMKNLRSLIVSECHRLTDEFIYCIARETPQLNHFNLRYCKRITDDGVNAIANNMCNLNTLDLSFCTSITITSIINLLERRHELLFELRLQNCTQLDVVRDHRTGTDGQAGREILNIIQSLDHSLVLSMLDLRFCKGQDKTLDMYSNDDPFIQGMMSQRFEQQVRGLFIRTTTLNASSSLRLGIGIAKYSSDT